MPGRVHVFYRNPLDRLTYEAEGVALKCARPDLWPVHLTDEAGRLTDVIRIFRRAEVISSRLLD